MAFFLLALLGFFGSGRAQAGPPAGGPTTRPAPPPIDQAAVPRTATATFALG
jgi:hypothetical protein